MSAEVEEEAQALSLANKARTARLSAEGIRLEGTNDHYTHRLLEELVGERVWTVRLRHEQWLAEQLDEAERIAARRRIAAISVPPIGKAP